MQARRIRQSDGGLDTHSDAESGPVEPVQSEQQDDADFPEEAM